MTKILTYTSGLGMLLSLLFLCCTSSTPDQDQTPSYATVVSHPAENFEADMSAKIIRFQDESSGKFGYKDSTGEIVTAPIYDGAMAYKNTSRIRVMKDGKYGFINDEGEIAIPLRFDQAHPFSEDYAAVQLGGKWGYIDINGNVAVETTYQKAQKFRSSLAAVMKDGKWGYVSRTGNITIPFEYQRTAHFSNGLAPVMLNGKWGYINTQNEQVLSLQYDWAEAFNISYQNLARVAVGNKAFFINNKGKCVKDCKE